MKILKGKFERIMLVLIFGTVIASNINITLEDTSIITVANAIINPIILCFYGKRLWGRLK